VRQTYTLDSTRRKLNGNKPRLLYHSKLALVTCLYHDLSPVVVRREYNHLWLSFDLAALQLLGPRLRSNLVVRLKLCSVGDTYISQWRSNLLVNRSPHIFPS
jgi:hypothetical protein